MRFLLTLLTVLSLGIEYVAGFGDDHSCPKGDPDSWTPDWLVRDDLVCQCTVDINGADEKQYETFCKCNAYPKWRNQEQSLNIEYITVMGKSLVIPESEVNTSHVYKVHNSDVEMTELPSNLCSWDTDPTVTELYSDLYTQLEPFFGFIVSLDFSEGSIRKLGDVNCLERLDTLDLSRNKITHVSNTSFHKLNQLRVVNFAHNWIVMLDPSITSGDLRLMRIDFSYNDLTTMDVSNMYSEHPFCGFNYKNNTMNEMTNEVGVEVDKSYGPGFVNLQNNIFNTFPDFEEILGLDSISEVGQVLGFGFDFRGIQLECDCNLQPFRSLSDPVIKSIWRDYMNITCNGPKRHEGKLAFDVPKAELICPIKDAVNVTAGCKYTDVPQNETLYVECTGLKRLPEHMPRSKFSKYIHLNVTHNDIDHIGNVSYLNKLSVLDISHNALRVLEEWTARQMENASYIDLSNNPNLRVIPQILQYRRSCSVNGKNLVIICDCETRWIISWLGNRRCSNDSLFECQVEGYGRMIATSFSESMVECESETSLLFLTLLLSGVMALLILTATLTYLYKYELLILFLRIRKRFMKSKTSVQPQQPYDVYVIVDEENDLARKWIKTSVVPNLETYGYRVFLPFRDMEVGVVQVNAIIEKMNICQNFLVILTESYLYNEDSRNEWKYAWNLMKGDAARNIVMINFDFVSSFDVDHPQIRAYLRVGNVIEFDNWSRDMMPRIIKRIGPLQRPRPLNERAFFNKKPTFEVNELFVVHGKLLNHVDEKFGCKKEQANIRIIRDINITKIRPGSVASTPDIFIDEHPVLDEKKGVPGQVRVIETHFGRKVFRVDGAAAKDTEEGTPKPEHLQKKDQSFGTHNRLVQEKPRPAEGRFRYYEYNNSFHRQ